MEIFLNGDYLQTDQVFLHAFDRGFLFGDGLFTTIKVEGFLPLFLNHHISRLSASCRFFGIEFHDPGFSDVIDRLLRKNRLAHARVKIIISRGIDAKNRIVNYPGGTPTIAVYAFPLPLDAPQPLKLCISKEVRGNESIYHHKTISYLQSLHHKTTARERGFDDAIILDWQGHVLETSTANLFFIAGRRIITPPHELPLLNGIMRQQILSQKSIGNYQVVEESLTKSDLHKVDGAFVTSAIVEICPVMRIEAVEVAVKQTETLRKEWLQLKGSIRNG